MADLNTKLWPKTPAGTVDWETVFEDEETGLIALIGRADTPDALRDTANQVIRALFARRNDAPEVERLAGELIELIPDGATPQQLTLIADAIVSTLRGIKDLRKEKAAEYEKEQAEKQAAGKPAADTIAERRKEVLKSHSIKQALAARRRKRVMWSWIGGAAAVAGAAALFVWLTRDVSLPPDADRILVQQIKTAAAGGGTPVHIYGGALRTERDGGDIFVIAEHVPAKVCTAASPALIAKGRLAVNGREVRSITAAGRLCEGSGVARVRLRWMSAE